ncbi:SecY-interacting protein [Dongshaea marina]|uniref:SecY-interacting protein n=1 Tax=Dongshaea marina TaxID=2047966 RepID=UPI000D3E84E2|nr:SecY-interacting protein [Dongshaea marina]
MANQVFCALQSYIERWQHWCKSRHLEPKQEFDADWLSPCQQGKPREDEIVWWPSERGRAGDFSNVEQALELSLHSDVCQFYSHYFSGPLPALYKGLAIELVQPWNEEDFSRLQENLIGHLLMQKKLKRAPTLFIASCRDEMQIISVDNQSGEVLLEKLSKGQRIPLGVDLSGFLDRLEPWLGD